MKIKNIILYAYLTILSGLLIACTIFLSIGEYDNLLPETQSTIKVALSVAFILIIAMIILAPRPSRLRHITVFGEPLTVDVQQGTVCNARGIVILDLKDTELEGIQDMDQLTLKLETIFWYDYQDNKA